MTPTSSKPIQGIESYLVVDDHAPFRGLLRSYLPAHPAEIFECENGEKAIARYTEIHPDWVLMDVEMPGIDGLTATRDILRCHPEARIVILTQHDSPELRQAALAAGARAFLSKAHLDRLPNLLTTLIK